ncbi:MAG: hypothetical protein AAFX57_16130 [Bacteroidota bacterium]
MKYFSIVLIIICTCKVGICQVRQQAGKLNVNTAAGGIVETKQLPVSEVSGTMYLDEEWYLGNIYLKNQSALNDVRLRYDIEKNQFELNQESQVRVLKGVLVSHFEYKDAQGQWKHYDSHVSFPGLGQINEGFFERIVDGNPGLFLKSEIEVIKPNYLAALDVGERSTKYVKNEIFYLLLNGTTRALPKKRKEFYALFGDYTERIKEFAKANNINVKQREGLVQVIRFAQSMLK